MAALRRPHSRPSSAPSRPLSSLPHAVPQEGSATAAINSISFHRTADLLVTASDDDAICLYNTQTAQREQCVAGGRGERGGVLQLLRTGLPPPAYACPRLPCSRQCSAHSPLQAAAEQKVRVRQHRLYPRPQLGHPLLQQGGAGRWQWSSSPAALQQQPGVGLLAPNQPTNPPAKPPNATNPTPWPRLHEHPAGQRLCAPLLRHVGGGWCLAGWSSTKACCWLHAQESGRVRASPHLAQQSPCARAGTPTCSTDTSGATPDASPRCPCPPNRTSSSRRQRTSRWAGALSKTFGVGVLLGAGLLALWGRAAQWCSAWC